MPTDLYLSQVLDVSHFTRDAFNVIVAPCGCGKTVCAIERIAALATSPARALYLIDTTNGCARLANDPHLQRPEPFYEFVIGNRFPYSESGKIVVTTYAQFGVWESKRSGFAANFDVIICDEVHNLVHYANFKKDGTNYAAIAREALCRGVGGDTLIVGMTATPEKLKNLPCIQFVVPIDLAVLRHYENKTTVYYTALTSLLPQIPLEQKGILYLTHVKEMKKAEMLALSLGRNPVCIWSIHNTDDPMNERQLWARDYILMHEALPPQIDLLIINASCETSINIRGHIDFFIVQSKDESTITQARGRYRNHLGVLYLPGNADHAVVPQDFLDRPLFLADKQALRAAIGIKDAKGHLLPYEKLWELLRQKGYDISTGRKNNRAYYVVTRHSSPCPPD